MSAHHTNSEFARSLPGAAAKGRRAVSSSRSPVTIIDHKHQMKAGTTRGLASGVMYRLTPAALRAQGHVHSFVAGSVSLLLPLARPRYLGRGLRALGSFPADGRDCNPRLANIHALDHSLNDAVQALKAHSKVPFRYVHKRSGGLVVNVQFPVGEVGNV